MTKDTLESEKVELSEEEIIYTKFLKETILHIEQEFKGNPKLSPDIEKYKNPKEVYSLPLNEKWPLKLIHLQKRKGMSPIIICPDDIGPIPIVFLKYQIDHAFNTKINLCDIAKAEKIGDIIQHIHKGNQTLSVS